MGVLKAFLEYPQVRVFWPNRFAITPSKRAAMLVAIAFMFVLPKLGFGAIVHQLREAGPLKKEACKIETTTHQTTYIRTY